MSDNHPESGAGNVARETITASESMIREQADQRLLEAQLSMVTARLNGIPDFKRDPTGVQSDYVKSLVDLRRRLLEQVRPQEPSDVEQNLSPVELLVANIGPYFSPWIEVNLPYVGEGVNETPGVAGTYGEIRGSLGPGMVGFHATNTAGNALIDRGTTEPDRAKLWIHTWTCSYVFPEAPYTGILIYRFNVGTSLRLYYASVNTGFVGTPVTIGTVPDIHAGNPFTPDNTRISRWPIGVHLPVDDSVIRYVEEPIVGRISVQKGNHPAVAITFGIIAGVASGLVQFDGLFAAYLTLPGRGGQDELQYRYESLEWMNAVNDRARAT